MGVGWAWWDPGKASLKSEAEPMAELFQVREGFQELGPKVGPAARGWIRESAAGGIGGQRKAEGRNRQGP